MKAIFAAFGVSTCFCLVFAGSALASPITGIVNIGGSVTVTPTSINFAPTFVPQGAATSSFSGFTGGTIQSLTGGPVVGAVDIVDFATFNGVGLAFPIMFDLTDILPGTGTLANCSSTALGAQCTPAGSPFTLTNQQNDVVASLNFTGISYSGSSLTGSSPTSAGFTTQFVIPGVTIPQVLAALGTPNGIDSNVSYSAAFTASPVPEPGTTLLFGSGLIGLSLMLKRRRRS